MVSIKFAPSDLSLLAKDGKLQSYIFWRVGLWGERLMG